MSGPCHRTCPLDVDSVFQISIHNQNKIRRINQVHFTQISLFGRGFYQVCVCVRVCVCIVDEYQSWKHVNQCALCLLHLILILMWPLKNAANIKWMHDIVQLLLIGTKMVFNNFTFGLTQQLSVKSTYMKRSLKLLSFMIMFGLLQPSWSLPGFYAMKDMVFDMNKLP